MYTKISSFAWACIEEPRPRCTTVITVKLAEFSVHWHSVFLELVQTILATR